MNSKSVSCVDCGATVPKSQTECRKVEIGRIESKKVTRASKKVYGIQANAIRACRIGFGCHGLSK